MRRSCFSTKLELLSERGRATSWTIPRLPWEVGLESQGLVPAGVVSHTLQPEGQFHPKELRRRVVASSESNPGTGARSGRDN